MKVYDEVLEILQQFKETRNSDFELFKQVCLKRFIGLNGYPSWSELSTVNYETYSRARREVQEHHPELQADESVQAGRKKKEDKKGLFVFEDNGQASILNTN